MSQCLFRIQDFKFLCRTCLQNKKILTPIFHSDAGNMLNFCDIPLQMHDNDLYPDQICVECLHALEISYKFKQQCESANATLEKVFNEDKFKLDINNYCAQENSDDESNTFLYTAIEKNSQKHDCLLCRESFNEKHDLDVHQSVHSGKGLVCNVCSKIHATRQMLKRHIKNHMHVKEHVCTQCNRGFTEAHALTKHNMHKHLGIPKSKKHECSDCGQRFSEPYYLNLHKRKHTGEKPLVCGECNKAFSDPRSFKAHKSIHVDEKPFNCIYCEKGFSQKSNQVKHMRTHTGETPFVCEICDKGFVTSTGLKKHTEKHSVKQQHTCDVCDKCFTSASHLRNHSQTHTNSSGSIFSSSNTDQTCECLTCHKKFRNENCLGRHLKAHVEKNEKETTVM